VNLIEKVKAVIDREGLIPPGATVLVGLSGGADSAALLHILHRLGYLLVTASTLEASSRSCSPV